MHEELWAGIGSKLQNAMFHFQRMEQSIQPPERTHMNVVLESSGAIIDTGWQRAFYAYFDAFLSATRSIPEIVQCCFGVDFGHPQMRAWFQARDEDEQIRRKEFSTRFDSAYKSFRALDLSIARHISEHRRGYAPVEVKISGLFGVVYIGSQVKPVPSAETPNIDDPRYAFLARARAIRPNWQDFEIDGKPLFDECQNYLRLAGELMEEGRKISYEVHGNRLLTPPPM
jgi:hypothetical protein